nr:MAG TPA: hypothetical protein [Caudoviricetes sp.]
MLKLFDSSKPRITNSYLCNYYEKNIKKVGKNLVTAYNVV